MSDEREVLLHKTPQGEFECLIWERHMNKELSAELSRRNQKIGTLESEIEELKYKHRKEMEDFIKELRKTGHGQVVVKKAALKKQVDALLIKNKNLKRENDKLMSIIVSKNRNKVSTLK